MVIVNNIGGGGAVSDLWSGTVSKAAVSSTPEYTEYRRNLSCEKFGTRSSVLVQSILVRIGMVAARLAPKSRGHAKTREGVAKQKEQ